MLKFEPLTKVKVIATGQTGEIIAHDYYGTNEQMLRANPKPYRVNIDGELLKFDEEELEALSN